MAAGTVQLVAGAAQVGAGLFGAPAGGVSLLAVPVGLANATLGSASVIDGAGYVTSVQEYTGNVNGPVLWNLNLLDAQGNAISETYGNGLWLQNRYDAATGEHFAAGANE